MKQPQNLFFVGRQAELTRFKQILTAQDPLTIINVCGHSGVGKSWLMEEFRGICRDEQIPFAYLNPRDTSGDPVSLLIGFAQRMGLYGEWREGSHTFVQLLAPFVDSLFSLGAPAVTLMLDNYDYMRQFDPQVRHLIRYLSGRGSPDGSAVRSMRRSDPPRVLFVIGSQTPLRDFWPLNPLFRDCLEDMPLVDFTMPETRAYLGLPAVRVPARYYDTLFHLTQGYPLALALLTNLPYPKNTSDGNEIVAASPLIDPENHNEGPHTGVVLFPAQKTLGLKVLKRALRVLGDGTLRADVIELLRASSVVRRFDQPLLAALLDRPTLPDALFDRVTALSMVAGQTQAAGIRPRVFVLHNALRKGLLTDARERGLKSCLEEYRRRALAYYRFHLDRLVEREGIGELGLDILFLHSNPSIRDLFFSWTSVAPVTGLASFDELSAAVEPLMRQNPWYRQIGFEGPSLDRLIQETYQWLDKDRALHGDPLQYFQVVRRADGRVAGFILTVPAIEEMLPLLREDTLGAVCEAGLGTLEVDERCYFTLRLVIEDWDCYSALIRAVFTKLSSVAFDTLVTASPWSPTNHLLIELGSDLLAEAVEYEGYTYAVVQLDVDRYGGAMEWLLWLVGRDVGLIADDWGVYLEEVEAALKALWDDPAALVETAAPLLKRLDIGQPRMNVFARAEGLRGAICTAAATLRPLEEALVGSHYQLLNEMYGLGGDQRRVFMHRIDRPTQQAVARALGIGYPRPFRKYLRRAVSALAQELLR